MKNTVEPSEMWREVWCLMKVKMATKTTKRNLNVKDDQRERKIIGFQREVGGDDEWIK